MAKNDDKNKPKPYSPKPANPMKYARRMLKLYRTTAQNDYQDYANQMDNIWGAVSQNLPKVAEQFAPMLQANTNAYQQALGQLGGYMGGQMPAGESTAAANYFGQMGASGQGLLASQGARNAIYGESAALQAPIDQANAKANALQQMQTTLDEARLRLPEWAMQGQEYNLALAEYILRKQALEGQLAGYGAANDYMASTLEGGNNGNNNNNGANSPMTQWLSGGMKWNQLTPQQQAQIRDRLRADPGVVRQYYPNLQPRTMTIPELIAAINNLARGPQHPEWSPGTPGGPQY